MAPPHTPYSARPVSPNASDDQKLQNNSTTTSQTFNVYVTGFGPFRDISENSSYTIASTLPPILPAEYLEPHVQTNIIVNIHRHPKAVHVAYDTVDALIPEIHANNSDADLFLHLGIAPISGYRIEQSACRTGYDSPDVDNKLCPGRTAKCHNCVPHDVEQLHCGIDLEKLIARFEADDDDDSDEANIREDDYERTDPEDRARLKDEIQEDEEEDRIKTKPYISNDAGLYLCEYIYFNSMAEAIYVDEPKRLVHTVSESTIDQQVILDDEPNADVNEQEQNADHRIQTNEIQSVVPSTDRVLFLHVPWKGGEETIKLGRETVMKIIAGVILQKLGLS